MHGTFTAAIWHVLLLCFVFKCFTFNDMTKINVDYCALIRAQLSTPALLWFI